MTVGSNPAYAVCGVTLSESIIVFTPMNRHAHNHYCMLKDQAGKAAFLLRPYANLHVSAALAVNAYASLSARAHLDTRD